MLGNKYSEASSEVLAILDNTNQVDVKKISQSFISFLKSIAIAEYKPSFDLNTPINELNIKDTTKELLGFIYITWWCDENDKIKYKTQIQENRLKKNKEIEKQYNPNTLFKPQKEIVANKESSISMVEYKPESSFKKFINKILKFLGIRR